MSITTRVLKAGQVLEVTYKGAHHSCFVVKAASGKGLGFVVDKVEYASISGAGKSLHGSRAIGGYGFWSLVGENGKTPAAKTATAPKTSSKKAAAKKTSKRSKATNATSAGFEEVAK
jgi:hypothetical protein